MFLVPKNSKFQLLLLCVLFHEISLSRDVSIITSLPHVLPVLTQLTFTRCNTHCCVCTLNKTQQIVSQITTYVFPLRKAPCFEMNNPSPS